MSFFILQNDVPTAKHERRMPKLIPIETMEAPKNEMRIEPEPKARKPKTTKEDKKFKELEETEKRIVFMMENKPTKKQIHEYFKSRQEEL
jgi:hypothetical protein